MGNVHADRANLGTFLPACLSIFLLCFCVFRHGHYLLIEFFGMMIMSIRLGKGSKLTNYY
jgi:hypothetical protein